MGKITNFLMDTSLMGQEAVTRSFTVKGKPESDFILIVIQDGTLNYYNFESNLFELGHTSKNNLKVKISNSSMYRGTIDFPSGGGTYIVKLIAEEGTVAKANKNTISKTLEKQSTTTTATLKPATVNTSNYSTFPTLTSTGDVSSSVNIDSTFVIDNAPTDAGGFGLKINTNKFAKWNEDPKYGFEGVILREVFGNFWYVQSTKDIILNTNGDGLDSRYVTAANADGISVHMELFYHKATTTPVNEAAQAVDPVYITNITEGLGEVIIEFNQGVAFENGETMTLRAYGSKQIYLNTGISMQVGECYIYAPTLTKTVRADVIDSQTITLTDTHGLSGGNATPYIGLGVDNSASNNVSVVTPDCPDADDDDSLDGDGAITVQLTQNLKKGTILSFKGVYKQFTMNFKMKMNKHPESNTDILFDLDKIITVGVSGS
jgi:hypothetical protein